VSPGVGVEAQFWSHTAAPIALAAPIQSYPEFKKRAPDTCCQSYIFCDAKVKFVPHSFAATKRAAPLLEPRFAHRANYHRQDQKNKKILHEIDFILKNKCNV
jgi:hypothetical protein